MTEWIKAVEHMSGWVALIVGFLWGMVFTHILYQWRKQP